MDASVSVSRLWKVFPGPGQRGEPAPSDVADPAMLKKWESAGAVAAVRDVSFRVRSGEFFVIMGLSGSGKSTLVRCLIRLVEPTAGRVTAAGEEVTALDERGLIAFRRRRVAMVFQHYGLLPHRTVLENAAFGLKVRGMGREERLERARAALRRVGLEGWENRYPAELSGGMQQRVGIARALASDPAILLMDEPFSGLDPLIRREMQEELVRLHRELKKTIIFITHDLDEAMRLGDRLAVMKSGALEQVGTPEEILQAPATDYVRRFVNSQRSAGAHRLVRTGLPLAAGGWR